MASIEMMDGREYGGYDIKIGDGTVTITGVVTGKVTVPLKDVKEIRE